MTSEDSTDGEADTDVESAPGADLDDAGGSGATSAGDGAVDRESAAPVDEGADESPGPDLAERLEESADIAIEQFDEGLVALLSWGLDTETRARIYVQLRQHPESTSEEIAAATGIYPSTVREALAALHEEGRVTRTKRETAGAGNHPYEYSAMPPSEFVRGFVDDVQHQLNTAFNLDQYLDSLPVDAEGEGTTTDDADTDVPDDGESTGRAEAETAGGAESGATDEASEDATDGPVHITVTEESE